MTPLDLALELVGVRAICSVSLLARLGHSKLLLIFDSPSTSRALPARFSPSSLRSPRESAREVPGQAARPRPTSALPMIAGGSDPRHAQTRPLPGAVLGRVSVFSRGPLPSLLSEHRGPKVPTPRRRGSTRPLVARVRSSRRGYRNTA